MSYVSTKACREGAIDKVPSLRGVDTSEEHARVLIHVEDAQPIERKSRGRRQEVRRFQPPRAGLGGAPWSATERSTWSGTAAGAAQAGWCCHFGAV